MKGDFTKCRRDPEKHYSDVHLQQGRVLLDSDWNEQVWIQSRQREIEALDIIGRCGGPVKDAGFRIVTSTDDLTDEEKERLEDETPLEPGDFLLTAGRYYVDGILCENGSVVRFSSQPDLKVSEPLSPEVSSRYYIYMDVWKRHITHIEDPEIREIALGGPDTTTRTKTVWQVKALNPSQVNEDTLPEGPYCDKIARINLGPGGGRLSTALSTSKPEENPCSISPKGGYRGLENRLYRVEIHSGGQPYVVPRPQSDTAQIEVLSTDTGTSEVRVTDDPGWNLSGMLWMPGETVEVFGDEAQSEIGVIAHITGINEVERRLILDADISTAGANAVIRRVATFKWSRDNGSVAFAIEQFIKVDPSKDEIKRIRVSSLGRDKVSSLAIDDWVEVSGDESDLRGEPGTLAQIKEIDEAEREIVLSLDVSAHQGEGHPKVRRWDQKSQAVPITYDPISLELGIEIQFSGTDFRAGDYWCFWARTSSGEIDVLDSSLPEGIEHHYCTLGIIEFGDGIQIKDCRRLFDPLNSLANFFYVGGDGQEAMPGRPLDFPLQVGVSRGKRPLAGVAVEFNVEEGGGNVDGATVLPLETGPDGLAEVATWTLGSAGRQRVKAVMKSSKGEQIGLPIFFNAGLSIAEDVAYNPGCPELQGIDNVQDAITKLCQTGGGGGGCAVTVGKGGRFETLIKAIESMLGDGIRDICICLLPGEHELEEQIFDVGGEPISIRVRGCGKSTRLTVRSGPFVLVGFDSVVFSDMTIATEEPELISDLIIMEKCEEVEVRSCHIRNTTTKGSLLTLSEVQRLAIENCALDAYHPDSFRLHREVLGVIPQLRNLFEAEERRPQVFSRMAESVAADLASNTLEDRSNMANLIEESVRATAGRLRPDETDVYMTLIRNMRNRRAGAVEIHDGILGVFAAATRINVGIAISLSGRMGDAVIENNQIEGIVCLYGRSPGDDLKEGEAEMLAGFFREGALRFGNLRGCLQMRCNRVTSVKFGEEFLRSIREPGNINGLISDAFRLIFFEGNIVGMGPSFWAAKEIRLESNRFDMLNQLYCGICICESSISSRNSSSQRVEGEVAGIPEIINVVREGLGIFFVNIFLNFRNFDY